MVEVDGVVGVWHAGELMLGVTQGSTVEPSTLWELQWRSPEWGNVHCAMHIDDVWRMQIVSSLLRKISSNAQDSGEGKPDQAINLHSRLK